MKEIKDFAPEIIHIQTEFGVGTFARIVSKQLQADGTSKTIIYKPVQEEQKDAIKYITIDELEDVLNDVQDLKDELKEMKKEFKKKSKEE